MLGWDLSGIGLQGPGFFLFLVKEKTKDSD